MEPKTKGASVAPFPDKTAPKDGVATPVSAADPGEDDALNQKIRQKEAEIAKAVAEGQTNRAERLTERLDALKEGKAKRDKAREQQALLEAADALPDSGGFDDEDSANDDKARVAHKPKPDPDAGVVVLPPAEPSRPKRRHWAVILSFLLMVVLPTALAAWYLWERATDRYVSRAGFSVRTEEVGSAIELLGGVADLSGSSSTDPTILYAFIQSQEMVRLVDERLDLKAMWAKADPEFDPVFAYHPPGTIEDMLDYWERMVKVYNDDSGLIDLEVQAFSPADAQAIAEVIYDESTKMINRLSAIAREDSTSYARDELETAVEQLRETRVAMTQFRNRTQIVDPSASLQSQMGILSSLQQQLATALIEQDILKQQSVGDADPRMIQVARRVEVIEERIEEERRKLGIGSTTADTNVDPNAFANLVGEYESLQVDLQFAQESYTAARATFEASIAEARRQSRYLAAHVTPTLPERSELPDRLVLTSLVLLFSFLAWAMTVLTAYALRDRN